MAIQLGTVAAIGFPDFASPKWLACLRRRQLTEQLGWSPADREYGGWGFSLETPRKRPPGRPQERFFESNMVATIYGLAALRSAKVPAHDPAYGQILLFACRCQNFPLEPDHADPHYDDGGFFFVPDEPVQNKAGIAGTDCHGRRRFHSYGTMTADGLRVLLRCGLEPDDPRLAAARNWLETHFSATVHPGIFARDREVLRDGVYYYWVMAVSHAFMGLGVEEIRTRSGKCRWAEQLTEAVLRRQNADGSWTNRYTDAKEDDPLVSTPYAAAGLAICRAMITGDYKHFARGFPDRMTILAPEVAAAKP